MKQNLLQAMLCIVLLIWLPGCGKMINWGMKTFNQAEDVERFYEKGRDYLRSITIYDQFTTVGMFDALWLSDQARTAYAAAYSSRREKTDDLRKTFLRRQLEENNHFITFYILSPFEFPLGDLQSDWQLFLKVDNHVYIPLELKVTDLDPDYKAIFGKRYTRFKEAYLVKFSAKNLQDEFIISPQTTMIELCFKSSAKQGCLVWHVPYSDSESMNQKINTQEKDEKDEARLSPEVRQVVP